MKLKNTRKGPMIVPTSVNKQDGSIVANHGVCDHGEIAEFDPLNRGVQIYALADILAPVDAEGKKWLNALKERQE